MADMKAIGRRIRRMREQAGLDLPRAAQKTGSSWSTLQRLEVGRGHQPNISLIGALLKAYAATDGEACAILLLLADYPAYRVERLRRELDR